MSKTNLRNLTITAILAALICIMTAYLLHIPVPLTGGYIHLGDSLIFLAAAILPTPYAMLAGAIGGGLADLLSAPMWTLPTIIIKALIVLPFSRKGNKILTTRNLVAILPAFCISALGYYLATFIFYGKITAFATSVLGRAVQSFGSAVCFILFGFVLDKMKFKNRIAS